jgi:Domain of unknown function (DUF4145)
MPINASRFRYPSAAGVMYRRCLEGIVRDKGSQQAIAILDNPRGGLKSALDEMASDTSLHPELAKWAGKVRLSGNTGGHFKPGNDLSDEDARDLSRFVAALFQYLYVSARGDLRLDWLRDLHLRAISEHLLGRRQCAGITDGSWNVLGSCLTTGTAGDSSIEDEQPPS